MSTNFTQIENKPGTVGAGDFVMSNTAGGVRADAVPSNVVRIAVDNITAGNRQRKISPDTVDRLYRDIGQQGLLQPIGVQESRDGPGRYKIVYGLHRLLAFKKGWEEAKRLLEEKGAQDPDAYRLARMWQSIPAVVHESSMPLDYASLKEIVENLIRSELTKDERAVHETKYTHLVKKLGLTITADEKRALNAKNQHSKKKEGGGQNVQHPPVVTKPTATEKVTTDLGISVKDLHRSHQKVNELASAVARDKKLLPPVKVTPETVATPEAEHTLRLAELGAQTKAQVEKAGGDARKIFPTAPTAADEVTVRVDITDPKQLLDWFRKRLKDASKPMSLDYLRDLHTGLGELIAEAKPINNGD